MDLHLGAANIHTGIRIPNPKNAKRKRKKLAALLVEGANW